MVEITIYKSLNHITGYELSGHTNFAEYGQDIVCAAVSVLAQTTLMSLVEVCKVPEEDIEYVIIEDIGYLEVNLPNNIKNEILEKCQIVLETFELGIKSILESYPDNIALEYREV